MRWDSGADSYAYIKYRCESLSHRGKFAYVRTYMQIPHVNTEMCDPATCARQATKCRPSELSAYETLTKKKSKFTPHFVGWVKEKQGKSGVVPGGFLVSLAWNEVPGIQLEDRFGSDKVWDLAPNERVRIRAHFKDIWEYVNAPCLLDRVYILTLAESREIKTTKVIPITPSGQKLIWHRALDTLYESPVIPIAFYSNIG